MIEVILFFIGASLWLYILFGGADYGAGVLEVLPLPKNQREKVKDTINHAMGPVWEANHMWLILIVVILFMGFPKVFTTLMISLHIPVVALLVGIVLRGTAFTFRHYDAITTEPSQRAYTWIFGLSSAWSSLWLGVIAGSLYRGQIDLAARDAYTAYIAPWWGWFPLTTGIFTLAIFTFLAAIYLVGETADPDLRRIFVRRAFLANVFTVLSGALVFLASYAEEDGFWLAFASSPWALAAMTLATSIFLFLWVGIQARRRWWTRVFAGTQVSCILAGWLVVFAPVAMLTKQGPVSFFEAAAPAATQFQLLLALGVGSLFIFPSLFYLLFVFKIRAQAR